MNTSEQHENEDLKANAIELQSETAEAKEPAKHHQQEQQARCDVNAVESCGAILVESGDVAVNNTIPGIVQPSANCDEFKESNERNSNSNKRPQPLSDECFKLTIGIPITAMQESQMDESVHVISTTATLPCVPSTSLADLSAADGKETIATTCEGDQNKIKCDDQLHNKQQQQKQSQPENVAIECRTADNTGEESTNAKTKEIDIPTLLAVVGMTAAATGSSVTVAPTIATATTTEAATTTTAPKTSMSFTVAQEKSTNETLATNSSLASLPHAVSEPTHTTACTAATTTMATTTVTRRNHQQKRMKIFHDARQTAVTASTSSTSSITGTGGAGRSGSLSASGSPNLLRHATDGILLMPRRVSFPKSDNELVTGYLEPANPWEQANSVKSIAEIIKLYEISCRKHDTLPIPRILEHLRAVELNNLVRQQQLSLKEIKLAPSDCEALEEIFKRVQYKFIDLSSCDLEENAVSALFQMIEYYEAANELDISSNAKGMTQRGWTSCTFMVGRSQALQVLSAHGNPISKTNADSLGAALMKSNIHTLKLEHCGLKGAPLNALCLCLKQNKILKELWLAHNDLDCHDAGTIGDLLKVNHYLELVDISNNNIRDEGLQHIVRALIIQTNELDRRCMFQRSAAIDDSADCFLLAEPEPSVLMNTSSLFADTTTCHRTSPVTMTETTSNVHVAHTISNNTASDNNNTRDSPVDEEDDDAFVIVHSVDGLNNKGGAIVKLETLGGGVMPTSTTAECGTTHVSTTATTTNHDIAVSNTTTTIIDHTDGNNEADDDADDATVRSTSTVKNSTQSTGQSMLDKLLSMNSDSSSDDGASNLSTDTIAGPCSEDASIISDDIFEGTSAVTLATATMTTTATGFNQLQLAHVPIRIQCSTNLTNPPITTTTVGGATAVATSSNPIALNKAATEMATLSSTPPTSVASIAATTTTTSASTVTMATPPEKSSMFQQQQQQQPHLGGKDLDEQVRHRGFVSSSISEATNGDNSDNDKCDFSNSNQTNSNNSTNQEALMFQFNTNNNSNSGSSSGSHGNSHAGSHNNNQNNNNNNHININSNNNNNSTGSSSCTTPTTSAAAIASLHPDPGAKGNQSSGNYSSSSSNNSSNSTSCNNISSSSSDNAHQVNKPLEITCLDELQGQHSDVLLHNDGSCFEVTADERNCQVATTPPPINTLHQSSTSSMSLSARSIDVNKNTKLMEDCDDTHSTDSAFESASEGDISRHLPDEFSRLSTSLESTRLDDNAKEFAIETATIATESTECLMEAVAASDSKITPASTTTVTEANGPATRTVGGLDSAEVSFSERAAKCSEQLSPDNGATTTQKVQISEETHSKVDSKDMAIIACKPTLTPPPPFISPGSGADGLAMAGMRRTESACGFITQSTRNRSQSSDSLCSDNSLDGSITSDYNYPGSAQLNEKITKNDTLTRQQQRQPDVGTETTQRVPGGLKALAVWNNNLTKESGHYISDLLSETSSLELLNIGKNCLSNEFVSLIKGSLMRNTTLTTFGLQSAHLSAKGIETLSSILTFGGNSTLRRIDIRDNKLEVESLTTLADVLQSNTTLTQIDIDDEPKRLSFAKLHIVPFVCVTEPSGYPSVPTPRAPCTTPGLSASGTQKSVGSDAHMDYARVLETVRAKCSRNDKAQSKLFADKATSCSGASAGATPASVTGTAGERCRGGGGGYYVGSRKISLTCYSRPLVDNGVVIGTPLASNLLSGTKLDPKRKTGARLRSPVPSPPTISPSSSPNRNRFHVTRVSEVSPLPSPLAQTPSPASPMSISPTPSPSPSSLYASNVAVASLSSSVPRSSASSSTPSTRLIDYRIQGALSASPSSLPTSTSMPSMATITTSSTQSVKRSASASRSRFLVSKIYEDPKVPFSSRSLPPITPPINLPPTPMTRAAPKTELSRDEDDETSIPPLTSTVMAVAAIVEMPRETTHQEYISTAKTTATLMNTTITSITLPDPIVTTSSHQTTSLLPLAATVTISTTPSPISSVASTASSSSSSSSSTGIPESTSSSPSSAHTTSSASPLSPPRTCSSSSSSDYSVEVASSKDISDYSPHGIGLGCPIAIFGENDNDITLTKNSLEQQQKALLMAATTMNCSAGIASKNASEFTDGGGGDHSLLGSTPDSCSQQQQRVRKVSWIGNPATLFTLFQNFQRSTSPENKTIGLANNSCCGSAALGPAPNSSACGMSTDNTTTVATRKQSPPSWTRLGADILNASAGMAGSSATSAVQGPGATHGSIGGCGSNVVVGAMAGDVSTNNAVEQSLSFIDAASKQLRDLSKQVFRPNFCFGSDNSLPVAGAASSTDYEQEALLAANDCDTLFHKSTEEAASSDRQVATCDNDRMNVNPLVDIPAHVAPKRVTMSSVVDSELKPDDGDTSHDFRAPASTESKN